MNKKFNLNSKPDFQMASFGQNGSNYLSGTESSEAPYLAVTALEDSVVTLYQYKGDIAVSQVETANIVGTITLAGNATVTVTSAGMTGSPKAVVVALLEGDTAGTIAEKIVAALKADVAIGHPTTGKFTVTSGGTSVVLTANVPATNDTTLNIAIANTTCAGITPVVNSTNTTAGFLFTLTIPAGLTIFGDFYKIEMTSGGIIAYKG